MSTTARKTTAKASDTTAKAENIAFWNAIAEKNDELAQQYRNQAAAFTERMQNNPNNRAFINGYNIASSSADKYQSLADTARSNAENFIASMNEPKTTKINSLFKATASLIGRFSFRRPSLWYLALIPTLGLLSTFSMPLLAQAQI